MPGSDPSETSVSSSFTGLGITAAIDAMALPLRHRGSAQQTKRSQRHYATFASLGR